ncbi:MAG: hypothetical protein AVDCRST_MAG47-3038, partial [uncultured Nocardioidaceae bacterium]
RSTAGVRWSSSSRRARTSCWCRPARRPRCWPVQPRATSGCGSARSRRRCWLWRSGSSGSWP